MSGTGRLFLIPVDETQASQHSVDWVLENLYKQGDEFYFLHVIPQTQSSLGGLEGLSGVDSALIIDSSAETTEQKVEQAKQMLEQDYVSKAKKKSAKQRIEVVRFTTDPSSIGEVVVTRAEELNATAVVLASHNKSSLQQFLVGSVSQSVLKRCNRTTILLH